MMKMSITFSGGSKLIYGKKNLRKVLRQAGQEVASTARSLVRKGSTGGTPYRGKWRGKTASAPGQPPNSLSGALAKSIRVRPFKSGEGVAIRDTMFYAKFLEAGAVGGGIKGKRNKRRRGKLVKVNGKRVLAPRPFLSRALEMKRGNLDQRIKASVEQDIAFVKQKP